MEITKALLIGAGTLLIASTAEVLWQQQKIDNQKGELNFMKTNLEICSRNGARLQEALDIQNDFVESMKRKVEVKEAPKFENVIIKDNSCNGELQAYKDLFQELAR